ncbi:MAG: redoxin domain-containing protein [Bacteroidota bacterium]
MVNYPTRRHKAPGLYGDFWFNSEAFALADLQGYVVLVEFWDYASIGSLRSLDYVKEWHAKYRDVGLVVIGVHTPAFQFGRDRENLASIIKDLGIEFPVIADTDALIWTAYGSRAWPTMFILDKDGFVRFSQTGEGGYDQAERIIQSLLAESGLHGELPDLSQALHDTDIPGILCYRATGDIQTGYLRGAFGNPEGYSPEGTMEYVDHGLYLPSRFYLQGKWMNEKEFIRFDGGSGEEGVVTVRYEGADVYAVLAAGDAPARFLIQLNGEWLPAGRRGADIRDNPDGSTELLVSKPGIFHIIKSKDFGEYVLTLRTSDPSARVYSFSFVTSPIPEAVHSN